MLVETSAQHALAGEKTQLLAYNDVGAHTGTCGKDLHCCMVAAVIHQY